MKGKGIFKMVLLIILIVLGILFAVYWPKLSKEHKEAKSLSIANINFKELKNGTYIGEYEGGMYKWRTNKVQVTVSSGKVTEIKVLEQKYKLEPEFTKKLYDRVIKSQSLQVDTISGATLTSRACLKSVEIALTKAENK